MSDQEFDDFFKKAAANENIPYNPQAWKKMSAKLGKPGKSPFLNGKTIAISVILLISLIAITTWYFWPGTASETRVAHTNKEPVENKADAEDESNPERTAENGGAPSANPPVQTDTAYNHAPETLSEEPASASANKLSDLNNTNTDSIENDNKSETRQQDSASKSASGNFSATQSATSNEEAAEKLTDQKETEEATQSLLYKETSENTRKDNRLDDSSQSAAYYFSTEDFSQQISLVSGQPLAEPLFSQHMGKISFIPQHTSMSAADGHMAVNEIVNPLKPYPRWGLSFAFSPDLSNVNASPITQVGTKTGIGLEFFIWRHASLNTGLIFTNSLYTAGVEGYKPPYPGFWNKYDKPDNIQGQCKIVDIPLDIKVYVLQKKKNRFFISSGLSSYLMLNEKYNYVYKSYAHSPYKGYEVKNKNQHYFQIFNLSAGYERAIGNKWAFQANPFVKIPLSGVGAGEIKLLNLGVFLSLHYRFGFTQ